MSDTIFPISWEDKINSPDLLAYLQQFGNKTYLEANEINKIKKALNSLNERISETSDKILVDTGFLITGTNFKLNAGNKWSIFGDEFGNAAAINKTISLASAGMKKHCVVLLNVANDFYFKYGQEHPTSPPKPNKDPGTIELTDFPISESAVGSPTAPIIGNPFIVKNQFNQIAASVDKKFYLQQQSNYLIIDPDITEIKGIYLTENGEAESYTGKFGFFSNFLDVAVPMRHLNIDAPVKLKFPKTNGDYLIQPGETLYFIEESYNVADSNLWKCLNEKVAVNIKTINGQSLLGNGNLNIGGSTFEQSTWSFTDLYSNASPQGSFYVGGLAGGVTEAIQSYGTDGSGILVKTGTAANSGAQVSTGMGIILKPGATIYAEAHKRGSSILEVGGFYNWPSEIKIKVNEANQIQVICTNAGLTTASAFGDILIENNQTYGFLIEKLTATTASFKVYNSQRVLIFSQTMTSNVPSNNALVICAIRLYRPLAGANGIDIGALEYYGMGRAKPNFLNF